MRKSLTASPGLDFRAIFQSLAAPQAILDVDFRFVEVNQLFEDAVRRDAEDLLGRDVFDVFPEDPNCEGMVRDAFEQALGGEHEKRTEFSYSIPVDGEAGRDMREIWWNVECTPIIDRTGATAFIGVHVEDVSAVVRERRLKDAVIAEMQHRIGNILALVSSIARRTAAGEVDIGAFLESFESRIQALVKTHSLLTGGNWDGMTIEDLVHRHLDVHADRIDGQIVIAGPELRLSAGEAQAISMALHELATNAAKYGALKAPEGRLNISWNRLDGDGYRLEWSEAGLTGLAPPTKTGFGSQMLNTTLPSQLNGEAESSFSETGLRYRLTVARRMQVG